MSMSKNALLTPLYNLNEFTEAAESIKEKKTPVLARGVIDSQKVHLAWALGEDLSAPILMITDSEIKAKEIYEDMYSFYKDKVKFYPAKDIVFYNADVRSNHIIKQRIDILSALLEEPKEVKCIVLSVEALFDRLAPPRIFKEYIMSYSIGDTLEPDSLIRMLVSMGYTRGDTAEGAGQFSVRGGIVDICTPKDNAYRIEFFGDEIDSIRLLDAASQRSIENTDSFVLYPMRELVFDSETEKQGIKNIKEAYEERSRELISKGLAEENDNLENIFDDVIYNLKNGEAVSGLERYIQFFYEKEATLFDYLPRNTIIFLDEPARIEKQSAALAAEYMQSMENRILRGYMLPKQSDMVYSYAQIQNCILKFPAVLLTALAGAVQEFKPKKTVYFDVKSSVSFKNRQEELLQEFKNIISSKHTVIALAGTRARSQRFAQWLAQEEVPVNYTETLEDYECTPGVVTVSRGSLSNGFTYGQINFTVITDKEIFGDEKKRNYRKKIKKTNRIESFLDLKVGDYVVHDAHGVGIYTGIEKISTDGIIKDYLKLSYADGGSLYVPVSQMDSIQKYIGGGDVSLKLHKLGGSEWGRAKAKTKKAIKILAEDLVKLYAKRQAEKGFAFSTDTVWQKEFEESFEFEETEDQLQSIEEVKEDMESEKVMDRLLCGDVGYGKTEVAIRAAFKAVQDGKQVAYLVPTTILAQQHYNTFIQRMKDYPIGIELLSRFRTKKQQEESLQRILGGTSDILIGTHRILSADVQFKDLGLVIVDEEQRFGVTHKEKLKRMQENVDVLTLTATPIPRTLHMSLTGIRDMSVLEEPPQERRPVQTYVLEYDQEFVRDAIRRELKREGQVYFLHNRVRSIEDMAGRVQKLVPEATVVYAHGQMSERQLEGIMQDFIEKKIDVLVCTTIIETGLDISNVNTIIINNADKMGLSQLYQLRGRVGRTNRVAYAYLMYKKDKVLEEVAEKRLQTIREFTEFGSGFKIALRDLEIRGAGSLLGERQHGHIDAVGYDLYCRMLDDAIKELNGEAPKQDFITSIDVKINAYIPEYFIKNEDARLEMYKRVALIKDKDDLSDMQDELADRFGDLPKSVNNLLEVALLKNLAHRIGIEQISQKNNGYVMYFYKDTDLTQLNIEKFIGKYKNKFYYTANPKIYLTFLPEKGETLQTLRNYLQELEKE